MGSGAKPQPTNDLVHIGVKIAALVATIFVDFPKKKIVVGSNSSQGGAL